MEVWGSYCTVQYCSFRIRWLVGYTQVPVYSYCTCITSMHCISQALLSVYMATGPIHESWPQPCSTNYAARYYCTISLPNTHARRKKLFHAAISPAAIVISHRAITAVMLVAHGARLVPAPIVMELVLLYEHIHMLGYGYLHCTRSVRRTRTCDRPFVARAPAAIRDALCCRRWGGATGFPLWRRCGLFRLALTASKRPPNLLTALSETPHVSCNTPYCINRSDLFSPGKCDAHERLYPARNSNRQNPL